MALTDLTNAAAAASTSMDSLAARSVAAAAEYQRLLALMNKPLTSNPLGNATASTAMTSIAEWWQQKFLALNEQLTAAALAAARGGAVEKAEYLRLRDELYAARDSFDTPNPNRNVAASDRPTSAAGLLSQSIQELRKQVEAAAKAAQQAAWDLYRAKTGSAPSDTSGAATGNTGGSAGAGVGGYLPGTPAAKSEQAAWDARQAAADADQQATWDARQRAADEATTKTTGEMRHTTDILSDVSTAATATWKQINGQMVMMMSITTQAVAAINGATDDAVKKIGAVGANIGGMGARGLLP